MALRVCLACILNRRVVLSNGSSDRQGYVNRLADKLFLFTRLQRHTGAEVVECWKVFCGGWYFVLLLFYSERKHIQLVELWRKSSDHSTSTPCTMLIGIVCVVGGGGERRERG